MKTTTKNAVNTFVKLVGGNTWEIVKFRCTGKRRWQTDYSLLIDGKSKLFVSIGMNYFEQRILSLIESVKSFNKNKQYYITQLKAQVEKDNALAKAEGLHTVELKDIGIVSPNSLYGMRFLQPFAVLNVNGRSFKHTTTQFGFYIMENEFKQIIEDSAKREVFTAGAVEEPDYIFCNVRFSSKDKLYKIFDKE